MAYRTQERCIKCILDQLLSGKERKERLRNECKNHAWENNVAVLDAVGCHLWFDACCFIDLFYKEHWNTQNKKHHENQKHLSVQNYFNQLMIILSESL
jgi:hypothetical protein